MERGDSVRGALERMETRGDAPERNGDRDTLGGTEARVATDYTNVATGQPKHEF